MRRKTSWTGTPEIYFSRPIDNSRLVKVENPQKSREMRQFGIALACLFLLVMTFAWQHFKAIEYGYKIETLRVQRDGLAEMNRALRLEEASLRDPERIDTLAREAGPAVPASRPGDAHGYRFAGFRNSSSGQRNAGFSDFGKVGRTNASTSRPVCTGGRPAAHRTGRRPAIPKKSDWRLPYRGPPCLSRGP